MYHFQKGGKNHYDKSCPPLTPRRLETSKQVTGKQCRPNANHNNCHLLCHLLVILKAIFANSVDPDQTAPDLGPHCLPVCKNRFEKFARIFSRHHKQTTLSDAGFLGILRVNLSHSLSANLGQ